MDRSSNDGIYILFTESHEILANLIHIYRLHTYEQRRNRRIKKIFAANLNLRQIQMEMD